MSYVWESLADLQDFFVDKFNSTGVEIQEKGMDQFNQGNWVNRVWSSIYYRRAHIDVVDARDTHGLYMMHVCIFPHLHSDAPIFGFDVVAGKNKMTGAFHDFSPTVNKQHAMIKDFGYNVSALQWKRERELPDWAKAIFSGNMMAAGNVREEHEIEQVNNVIRLNTGMYLSQLQHFQFTANQLDVAKAHNRYAMYQKMNPHTPRVMKSLGLDSNDVDKFIQDCLFPEIALDKVQA